MTLGFTGTQRIEPTRQVQRRRRGDLSRMTSAEYRTNISEAEFQANILQLAKMLRWESYHTHDSRRSQEGFPDLILIRDHQLRAWELKDMKRQATPEQLMWLEKFTPVTETDARLLRPSDWDEVVRLLR